MLKNINIYRFLLKNVLSNYENKIDKKGRVSMPATFRSYLNTMGFNGFISYPSFNHSALEACSQDRIEKLSNIMNSLDPFEEKRDFLLHQYYLKVKIYNLIPKEGFHYQINFLITPISKTVYYLLV